MNRDVDINKINRILDEWRNEEERIRKEEYEKGVARGLGHGEVQAKINIAKKLVEQFDDDVVIRMTELDMEMVKLLRELYELSRKEDL